jgi:hypothetical protein
VVENVVLSAAPVAVTAPDRFVIIMIFIFRRRDEFLLGAALI